jgi:23S rRNA (cytosine1962-C5)-methyltransferase
MHIKIDKPTGFKDYELIDCGNFEKLERFGKIVLIRPEPQALWDKAYSDTDWQKMAHGKFVAKSSSSGTWQKMKPFDDRWYIQYNLKGSALKVRLALTSFKHVGIFPEQAPNWDFLYRFLSTIHQPKMLNLFAYTGMASLVAKAAGADVTHVDSVKQVVTWANENQTLSNLDGIKWVIEDALKFAKREVKRGKKYHAIVLDPPAYGHGASGESWILEKHLNEMIKQVEQLIEPQKHLVILNTYSLGFSSLIINNLFDRLKANGSLLEVGELALDARSGRVLPLGVFGRLTKGI